SIRRTTAPQRDRLMTTTRTGNFPIGFRRGWSDWQKDLGALIEWAAAHDFAALDVGPLPEAELKQIQNAGLTIGSVDLPQPWSALGAADPAARRDAARAAADYISRVAQLGIRNIFAVMFPEDDTKKRCESLDFLVD